MGMNQSENAAWSLAATCLASTQRKLLPSKRTQNGTLPCVAVHRYGHRDTLVPKHPVILAQAGETKGPSTKHEVQGLCRPSSGFQTSTSSKESLLYLPCHPQEGIVGRTSTALRTFHFGDGRGENTEVTFWSKQWGGSQVRNGEDVAMAVQKSFSLFLKNLYC